MKYKIAAFLARTVKRSLPLIVLLPLAACVVPVPNDYPEPQAAALEHTYVMHQKPWSLPDQFIIFDQDRRPVFQVKGKFFTIGDKLRFLDMDGRELAYISEQVVSLLKRYRIYRPDGSAAVIRKDIQLFNDKFTIKVPGEENLLVRGNFWDLDYCFYRRDRLVAVVSQKWLSWKDSYTVRVARGEDDVLILAAAVVIDMIKEDEAAAEREHRHHSRRHRRH